MYGLKPVPSNPIHSNPVHSKLTSHIKSPESREVPLFSTRTLTLKVNTIKKKKT
jgi:hypothetical protein